MIRRAELAPDIRLEVAGGGVGALSAELERGPVLLFFFKCDCLTTELAAPFVARLWREHRDHVSAEGTRLGVIGIAQEEQAGAADFAARHGIEFPIWLDVDLVTSRAYDLEATPTLVLLRGAERLRTDAGRVAAAEAFRVADVVEGWSKEGYQQVADEIAARAGALPTDLFADHPGVPASKPG